VLLRDLNNSFQTIGLLWRTHQMGMYVLMWVSNVITI